MSKLVRFLWISPLALLCYSCDPSQPVAPEEPSAIEPSFEVVPGNTGKIAFSSSRDGNRQIYVMNGDGTNQTNVSKSPGSTTHASEPAWSPDGTKIAFATNLSGGQPGGWDIYTMWPDGRDKTNVTNTPSLSEGSPTWSPDGSQIAFTSEGDIWVMKVDGSGLWNLTQTFADGGYLPDWSPDGTKILFVGQSGIEPDIFTTTVDGRSTENLTENFAGVVWAPDWSPDGKQIAFGALPDAGPQGIYVMDAKGSNVRNLTDPALGHGNNDLPEWSPDGKRIAFVSDRDGNREIYVMNADGSDQTRLTNDPASDEEPSWQSLPRTTEEVEVSINSFADLDGNGVLDRGEQREGSSIRIEIESGGELQFVDDCLTPCELLMKPLQSYYVWQLQEPNWDLVDITLDGEPAKHVERPPDKAESHQFVGTALAVGVDDAPHKVVFQNEQLVRVSQIAALLEDAWVSLLVSDITDSGEIEEHIETALGQLQREPPQLEKASGTLDKLKAAIAEGDPVDIVHLAYLDLIVDHCQGLLAQLLGT